MGQTKRLPDAGDQICSGTGNLIIGTASFLIELIAIYLTTCFMPMVAFDRLAAFSYLCSCVQVLKALFFCGLCLEHKFTINE